MTDNIPKLCDILARASMSGVRRSDICAAAKIPPYQMTRWLKGDVAIKPDDIKAVDKAAKRLEEAAKFPAAMRKRLALGISEVEIANALALDARTIREWEVRGRAPNRRKDALYVAAVDSIAGM